MPRIARRVQTRQRRAPRSQPRAPAAAIERPAAPVLRFLGAAGTVTGSRFLLDTPAARVLVDCGLFQGLKPLRLRNWESFPVDPSTIDAIVLTHAHVDHTGFLPVLIRAGFRGPVFATEGTRDLSQILLPDCGHLQEEEAAYANRKGFSKHSPALPLYTEEDAKRALDSFRTAPFGSPLEVAAGLSATLHPAGHILGSATVRVELEARRRRSIVFTGDLGRPAHPVLRPPAPMPEADIVVTESTYGDRKHEDVESLQRFEQAIKRTAERGGVAVIPSFAVDRTEIVLYHLRQLTRAGRIPVLPVYVDSPMALEGLAIYRRAIQKGSAEIQPELSRTEGPFDPGRLIEARRVEESKAINAQQPPFIIISASGMATGGRVLHHLANHLPDSRNSVVLVGFQVEGTRGRLLLDGARSLKMLGRYIPVRAEIVNVPGFSVHADCSEILAWLRTASRSPEAVFVVHGETAAAGALCTAIQSELGWTAAVPRDRETVRVD